MFSISLQRLDFCILIYTNTPPGMDFLSREGQPIPIQAHSIFQSGGYGAFPAAIRLSCT